MHMLSRNKIKSPEEQKLGEGGDDKQVIKLMWPNHAYLANAVHALSRGVRRCFLVGGADVCVLIHALARGKIFR